MRSSNLPLIYILGTGHCGSTLLDMLLNGSPEIHAGGELASVRRALLDSPPTWRRAAGTTRVAEVRHTPLLADPFWQEVERLCVERSGRDLESLALAHPAWREAVHWSDEQVTSWAEDSHTLISAVHEVAGTQMVTDSSKKAQRLYLLQRSGLFDIRVINLVRDGRAVFSSYIEKERTFPQAYRLWAGPRLAATGLRRRFTAENWIDVRYESLCSDPHTTMERICGFLGVAYSRDMLAYRSHDYHGVGGNRMRSGDSQTIFLDESWREVLPPRYRVAFEVLGGWSDRSRVRVPG